MNLFDAMLLGLLQGLTEFLPVSSSGHLVLAQRLLGFREHALEFDVVVHVATLLAVLFYFGSDVRRMGRESLRAVREGGLSPGRLLRVGDAPGGARLLALIVLGSIPTALIGLGFEDLFERLFNNVPATGAFFLATSVLLLLTGLRREPPAVPEGGDETLTPGRALVIGLVQGLAIAPGLSRSGATISAALLLGVGRESAARFSFLLSVPAILGALILRSGHLQLVGGQELLLYGVGFVAAFLSGWLALAALMRVVRRGALHFFGFYTAAVGAAALLLG